jgi:hypothetical protein
MSNNEAVKWDGTGTPKNGMLINRSWRVAGCGVKVKEVSFVGVDINTEMWVIKNKMGEFIALPMNYFSRIKSAVEIKNNEFLIQLANLLEEHNICLVSRKVSDLSEYTKIVFQSKDVDNMFPNFGRCHVSPYDLRGLSGMSSEEANELYHKFSAENKISVVAHQENTLATPNLPVNTCVELNRQNSMTAFNNLTRYGDNI